MNERRRCFGACYLLVQWLNPSIQGGCCSLPGEAAVQSLNRSLVGHLRSLRLLTLEEVEQRYLLQLCSAYLRLTEQQIVVVQPVPQAHSAGCGRMQVSHNMKRIEFDAPFLTDSLIFQVNDTFQ